MQAGVHVLVIWARAGILGYCTAGGGGVFELRIALWAWASGMIYGLQGQVVVLLAAVTKAASRATSAAHKNYGSNLLNMRLKNYKNDLNKRLRNPEYAAEYLAQVLAEKDSAAFLIALKDVVEAGGGMGSLAGRVGLQAAKPLQNFFEKGQSHIGHVAGNFSPAGLARLRGFGQSDLNTAKTQIKN